MATSRLCQSLTVKAEPWSSNPPSVSPLWSRTHLVEVAVGEHLARVTALDACAVDEDADLVVIGQDLGGQGGDLVLGGEVGRVDPYFAAELLDGVFRLGVFGVSLGSC